MENVSTSYVLESSVLLSNVYMEHDGYELFIF